MKNTKGVSEYAIELFSDSDNSVHSTIIHIVLFGFLTAGLLWLVMLIIFTVVFVVDIVCLIHQLVINLIGFVGYKLKENNKRVLKKLDSTKIEVFPLNSETHTLTQGLIADICEEIVRDQIGRVLDENENVSVMEINNLVDESVLVIFRYRRHDKHEIEGSTKDKLTSSVHIVKLTLNKLAQSVHIENVMSIDSDDLSHLQDPKWFIRDSVTALIGPVSMQDSTRVMVPVVN